MYDYLHHVSNNSHFVMSILKILVKSNGQRIENGGTKFNLPLNLKPQIKLNHTSKYNLNQTLGELQNACIELGEISRSKLSLEKIPMRSISTIIQHLVYVDTKGVRFIYCLQ